METVILANFKMVTKKVMGHINQQMEKSMLAGGKTISKKVMGHINQ